MQHLSSPPTLAEQADPAQEAKAFRRCLGQYATGVTVITATHGDKLVGMAVNSFAAVSLAPPMVLWSIRRESRSAQAFLQAGHFGVSILAAHQVDVAQAFGAGLADRFDRVTWHAGLGGVPLIDGAIAHLECRADAALDGGDHHILLGHVLRHARFEGDPLVFSQGQYAVTDIYPRHAAPAALSMAPANRGLEATPGFLRLLSVASQRLSSAFQVHRDALELTRSMARILSVLHGSACSLDELEQATFLGRLSLQDALSGLGGRGLVARTPGGQHELTPEGRHMREALAVRIDRFSQDKLKGVASTDIEAAVRVMSALQER